MVEDYLVCVVEIVEGFRKGSSWFKEIFYFKLKFVFSWILLLGFFLLLKFKMVIEMIGGCGVVV